MVSDQTQAIAQRAKVIYESRLRQKLEKDHRDKYVAIEPDSGDYYLGETYGDSVTASRKAHPDRISFIIRIGHDAAIQIGAISN
ncbi:MAG: hypothetical protein ACKVT0_09605 [Planctomycetaceae bacterium]